MSRLSQTARGFTLAAACITLNLLWTATAAATEATQPALAATATATAPQAIAGLRYDLEKIVTLREQSGWTIDRYDFEAVLPDVLMSMCVVTPAVRTATLARLDAAQAALGDAKSALARSGGDIDAIDDHLHLARQRSLLELAIARGADECPFYLTARPEFRGRQRDAGGITLNTEGGGLASVSIRAGSYRVGGGGAGRISLGFGIGEHWQLRVGPEIGGAALVDRSIRADDVELDFIVALPFALRRTVSAYVFDVEVAPLIFGIPWQQPALRYGGRIAVLGGVSGLRLRELLPWTGLVLMVEALAPVGSEPAQWSVRAGIRFGLSWRLTPAI
jgi:hypothetical protein